MAELSAISGISGVPLNSPISTTPRVGGGSGSSFSGVISGLVQDSNAQHIQADESVKHLVTGEVENVHDVVLSVAKADLSFRMLLEIRNRLIDAYQEIMRMQV